MSDFKTEQKIEQLKDLLNKWKSETENNGNPAKERIVESIEKELSWLKKQLKLN
jgi:hypothetical protein